MPKTYSTPDPQPEKQESEKQRETQREKTVGVYDRPTRKGPPRWVIIAIALAVAIALIILFLGLARSSQASALTKQVLVQHAQQNTAATSVVAAFFINNRKSIDPTSSPAVTPRLNRNPALTLRLDSRVGTTSSRSNSLSVALFEECPCL